MTSEQRSAKTLEELTTIVEKLETKINSMGKEKKTRPPKEPSEYNVYIKENLAKLKAENKNMTHSEAWSKATQSWKKHKEDIAKSDTKSDTKSSTKSAK